MIRFAPMSDEDFAAFLRKSIPEYAYDQTRSGNWTAHEAMGKARAEFQQMLPQGPRTPNQHLRVMLDERDRKIGMVWYFVDTRGERYKAFLIDFFFFSEDRHKGREKEAFAVLEDELRALGVQRIELQVFSHKLDEVALYQNNGFTQTSIFFAKDLA
ncbi:MAG: GNAT family N-acetyltransferase [Anaerolineales bacterium]|nr:GNAT family N-acetyltransferase [Anaerolineales bacterium]